MKIILSGGIAHRLCKLGHIIVDVRPKQENPMESVFVFYSDIWLSDDITFCMKNKYGEEDLLKERLKLLYMPESQYRSIIFEDYLDERSQELGKQQ